MLPRFCLLLSLFIYSFARYLLFNYVSDCRVGLCLLFLLLFSFCTDWMTFGAVFLGSCDFSTFDKRSLLSLWLSDYVHLYAWLWYFISFLNTRADERTKKKTCFGYVNRVSVSFPHPALPAPANVCYEQIGFFSIPRGEGRGHKISVMKKQFITRECLYVCVHRPSFPRMNNRCEKKIKTSM